MTADLDRMHVAALDESIRRLRLSGRNRHDDGLIAALLLSGLKWWTVADRLQVADGYVRGVARGIGA